MSEPQAAMAGPRNVFIVGADAGLGAEWVRDLAGLLAGHGHQVREVPAGEPTARLTGLLKEAGPGGVVIAVGLAGLRTAAQAGPGPLPIIGLCLEARQTLSAGRRKEIVEAASGTTRFLALSAEDADDWARAGLTNADVIDTALRPAPAPATGSGAELAAGPAAGGSAAAPAVGETVVRGPAVLDHAQGADLLVEAWAQVAPRHPTWRLRLGDTGPELAAVRRLADELGVADSIRFGAGSGSGSGPTAAIFALSSRQESLPGVLQDAMAGGSAVVAFGCAPVVRERLTDELDGLLVSPGNTERFGVALDRLMGDEGLRRKLGAAARESVLRSRPEAVLGRWERLFRLVYR